MQLVLYYFVYQLLEIKLIFESGDKTIFIRKQSHLHLIRNLVIFQRFISGNLLLIFNIIIEWGEEEDYVYICLIALRIPVLISDSVIVIIFFNLINYLA